MGESVTLAAAAIALLVSAPALPPDAPALLETVARAREALRGLPELWGADGSGIEWVLAGEDGAWRTTRAGGAEALEPVDLPPGVGRANTAIELGGRRYAMVRLPLGGDAADVRLLVHEAVHTLQPEHLPAPPEPVGAGADLLDGEAGRTWLFLELRALAAALTSSGAERLEAARDALRFRARRDALATPGERARQDALDLSEGLPEYTALRLTGLEPAALAARLRGVRELDVSWVRHACYHVPPAYGFVLDAVAEAGWRERARGRVRLPELLASAVGAPTPADLEARGRRHGLDEVRAAERSRARAHARRLAELRARFVDGPVLRLLPGALRITFDPRTQVPLAEAGNLMENVGWSSADGAMLTAPGGALVSPRWEWLQVPLGKARLKPGPLAAPASIEGDGWSLRLPAGWVVARRGRRLEVRPATEAAGPRGG